MNANSDVARGNLWKGPALGASIVVVVFLAASRVVHDWRWHPAAFVVLGVVVFGLGFVYRLLTRNWDGFAYRAAVGIAFFAGFGLVWGSLVQRADVNPDAVFYFGVPLLGIIGAAVARLRPKGMAWALFVTAIAQFGVLAVVVIRMVGRNPEVGSWTAPEWRGIVGNVISGCLFVASGLFFRKAGRNSH